MICVQALCEKMKRIRSAPNRMNHHSGTTSIGYRVQEHELAGHAAPLVAAFKDAYAKDKIGATHVVNDLKTNIHSYV